MAKLTETQTELLKGVRAALDDMATELEREIGLCDEIRSLDLVRVQIDRRLREAAEVQHG